MTTTFSPSLSLLTPVIEAARLAPAPTFVVDGDALVLFANDSADLTFGPTARGGASMSWLDLVASGDRAGCRAMLSAADSHEGVVQSEARLLGTAMLVRARSLSLEIQPASGWIISVSPLAGVHSAELRPMPAGTLAHQWALCFEGSIRGISVTDPATGLLTSVNPAFARMHGGTVDDFVDRPLASVFTPESAARIPALAEEVHRTGFIEYESEHVRLDGTTFPVRTEVFAALDSDGAPLYRIGWFEDLTERRALDLARRETDARMETLVRVAPVGIYECDESGAATFVNDTWCELAGLDHEQAMGLGWMQALHPEDRDRLAEGWEQSVTTGQEFREADYRFLHPDGTVRWVSGNGVPLHAEDGTVTGFIGTCQDITETRLAAERLERAGRYFDVSRDLLVTAGYDGMFHHANSAWETTMGITAAEMCSQPFMNFVHPDDTDATKQVEADLMAGGILVEFRNRYRHRNGDWRWLEWTAVGVPAEQLMYWGARDVTARVELEEQLKAETAQHLAARRGLEEAQALAHLGSWEWTAGEQPSWSAEQFRIHGFTPGHEAPLPEELLARVHPDDRDRVGPMLDPVWAEVAAFEIEYRVVWPNGEIHHLIVCCDAIERDGERTLVGTGQDVTQRREADSALRASEELLAEAQALAGLGSWEWQPETDSITWSEGTYRLYGQEPGSYEPTLESVLELTAVEDRPAVEAVILHGLESDEPFTVDHRTVRPDGEVVWLHTQGRPGAEQYGRPRRMVGTSQDITARKRMEQELERSNGELERFAQVASHDMQEPLRVVSGFLELLERRHAEQLDDEGQRFIGLALTGSRRLQQLIRDLLDFSRVTQDETPFEPVEMTAVADAVLADLSVVIEEAGAVVRVTGLPHMTGDPKQLRRLLQNLISNGIKFRNGQAAEVRVEGRSLGEGWELSVADNGIGIPEEQREAIFAPFKRLHTQDDYAGSGLGLAICQRIVERHGGVIRVEPVHPSGSRFVCSFPAVDAALGAQQ